MRNKWYKNMHDIIKKYGIKEVPYGYRTHSCYYKGVYIFDHYGDGDCAFRKYDTKTHEFGTIEAYHRYSYISFIKALEGTLRNVKDFLIYEKYKRIREDFE